MITRRGLFGVLAGAVAAPIVVRAGLLMPVRAAAIPAVPLLVSVPLLLRPGLDAVVSTYADYPDMWRQVFS